MPRGPFCPKVGQDGTPIDPFHDCKASFPARQLVQLMAASSFLQTHARAFGLCWGLENVDVALVMKPCARE